MVFAVKHRGKDALPFTARDTPVDYSLAASDADALDLIEVNEKTAAWGGRYSIYRVLSGGHQSFNTNIMALAKRAAQADSVALELAVTAAFLADNGYDDAWNEVAERKRAKATPEMMAKAKALYRDFQKIEVPNALPNI
ncbi:hypothetical protein NLM16_10460 [Bradyrhizobium brasilense]|uniref:hypothetical protein n=1 Tax=Bradyrhizobium brasilense TaxID=1419277 RepID=UPI0028779566|nr:hypothetical protein [Bradyrhizobium brasilense]MCP3414523.1 hypothetical protein [Bradyrhizobium brasilense]